MSTRYVNRNKGQTAILTTMECARFAELLQNCTKRQDFWENMLDSFSCFYIKILYSNVIICGDSVFNGKMSKETKSSIAELLNPRFPIFNRFVSCCELNVTVKQSQIESLMNHT